MIVNKNEAINKLVQPVDAIDDVSLYESSENNIGFEKWHKDVEIELVTNFV
jgi:hypothetical protein